MGSSPVHELALSSIVQVEPLVELPCPNVCEFHLMLMVMVRDSIKLASAVNTKCPPESAFSVNFE